MTDAPITAQAGDRIIVKPAHPGARIPDPAHGNFLAQDGAEVVWDHAWILRALRGEIVIVEPLAAEAAGDAPPPESPPGA